MADSKEIGRWLIANAKKLNLKVTKSKWTDEWLPTHKHVSVEIHVDGTVGHGTGMDESEDLALIKAGSEAIERVFCAQNNIHSNGVAAHPEAERAKENAMYELLERDAFLSHYFTKEPFILDKEVTEDSFNFGELKSRLKNLGINFNALGLKTKKGHFGYVCFSSPASPEHDYSSILGLGYADKRNTAFVKAITECLLGTIYYLHKKDSIQPLDLDEFNRKQDYGPNDHRDLFFGSSFQKEIESLVSTATEKNVFDENAFNISYKQLYSKSNIFSDIPLRVFQAFSTDVQGIFYGPTSISSLNIERLKRFKKMNLKMEDLNMLPHCVG